MTFVSVVAVSWLDYIHTRVTEPQEKADSSTRERDFHEMWRKECANLRGLLKQKDHFQAGILSTLLDTEMTGGSQGCIDAAIAFLGSNYQTEFWMYFDKRFGRLQRASWSAGQASG